MSQEAINFKKENINLNYRNMSLAELNNLPLHNGVIEFKITKTSFLILNIFNDDSSAVKYFWYGSHDLESLNLWYEISKEEGIYVDVDNLLLICEINLQYNLISWATFYYFTAILLLLFSHHKR